MFEHYKPAEQEIIAVQYKTFLMADRNKISDQNELLGVLVKAILTFDYYYHYSDDHAVWTSGREKEEWVRERIDEIEDPKLRNHLSRCFNTTNHKEVIKPFPWGEYVFNTTKYQQLCFDGMEHDRACYGVGLINWLNNISYMVNRGNVQYRAVYSDNIPLASTLLREGCRWFDDELIKPACVTTELWVELTMLGNLYRQNTITYQDLREFMGNNVKLMIGMTAEVLLINNFYMVFPY